MSKYEFSLTTFNPSGKLLQIEYALNAMQGGSTCLGIKTRDGVVLGAEKKLPPLLDPESVQKLSFVTEKIGMAYAGMGPDSRVLLRKGRKAGQQYWLQHAEQAPVAVMVKELASIMQEYTQSGGVRPFGVSLLVAGYDHFGPQLYQVDPSGSYWAWKAAALGKNMTRFVINRIHYKHAHTSCCGRGHHGNCGQTAQRASWRRGTRRTWRSRTPSTRRS